MSAEFAVVFDNAAIAALGTTDPRVRAAMDRLAGVVTVEMKRLCPVSKVQPVYASGGAVVPGGVRYAGDFPLRPSGYLRSSIHAFRLPNGDIIIGPTAPYAGFVNDGTPAHVINSTGPWPLRNSATGQVFGPRVQHPGTRGVHYIEKSALVIGGVVHLG